MLILVSLDAAYYLSWAVVLVLAWLGQLDVVLGIPMHDLARTAPIFLVVLQFSSTASKLLACLAIWRRWRAGIWLVLIGIFMHLALWTQLTLNPIYDGRFGHYAIILEFTVFALALSDRWRSPAAGEDGHGKSGGKALNRKRNG